ncbi:hypothetical protein [uncultured Tateyamaria sp.]|uniref:hypothetical protein n=1 Tax=uncultured Tateyamaria sp. TaxID=455651 RepID=UPI0026131613|nr:hypothetical protein [uncultured Tateyamaria sp.]
MRVFWSFFLAICLLVYPAGHATAQSTRDGPRGAEPIPGYSGLYVADASRFMAGAFVVVMLTRPTDVQDFLGKVKTCSSTREVVARLRREDLNTALIRFPEASTALRTGVCDVFIGGDFDFAQLSRRLDAGSTTSDTDRPNPDDDVGRNDNDDDVQRVDRTPPTIAPQAQVVEGQGRTAAVRARIFDAESGIQSVFLVYPDNSRVRMTASQGAATYSATVNLPRDFNDQTATILATNSAGLTARATVTVRLLPWCGPRVAVSNTLVREVQENLACVGQSPGGSDGALGPNTCTAIGGYLGGRMDIFNAGRIRWADLRDELSRACLAVQPVRLDVPAVIEIDAPRTNVRIGLLQAGPTRSIRITGPSINDQIRQWRGQPLSFDLQMPQPGETASYRVQALGPEGNARDTAAFRLIRPPVQINVSPSGVVRVDTDRAEFRVTIPSGASAVSQIEARMRGAEAVGQFFDGGSEILTLPSPEQGEAERVMFVALDRSGRTLAEQTVTLTRSEPPVPPRLTVESAAGQMVDASSVQLKIVLERAGAVSELILRRAPDMVELARRPVGNGLWDSSQEMPPPGEAYVFHVQAVDRSGKILAEDAVRVERPAVRLEVRPTGLFEADTDVMTAEANVTTGADWIETIIARAAGGGSDQPMRAQSAVRQGRAELRINMPEPGATQPLEIMAMGRDGRAYASARIVLARPAVTRPVRLLVTSPDGFEVEASATRLSVEVLNPADTALIVVTDTGTNQVLARGRFNGAAWLGEINMPEPGQRRELMIEAQDASGRTLSNSQVMLFRPATAGLGVPPWVWMGGLVLGVIGLGLMVARQRGSRRIGTTGPEIYAPQPRLRVVAEPDRDPCITLEPAAPPSLAVRIEADDMPAVEIEYEEDKELDP